MEFLTISINKGNYYDQLEDMFYRHLGGDSDNMDENRKHAEELADKMIDYYLKTSINDLMKIQSATLSEGNPTSKVAFRTQVLTGTVPKNA